MSTVLEQRAKQIFEEAVELESAARAAFVREQCAQDGKLRGRVEELLMAAESGGNFLRAEPASLSGAGDQVGDQIGPYTLLERLGEGGFGTVFLAEQHTPVQRRVALKLLKLGMDSRAVLARFALERQALAAMDHPHIARIFDAGVTATGRPYFSMEYVAGRPITSYCDEQHARIEARIGLMLQVCAAVGHAHTKGIVHRDIKPANVLVSTIDGKALVKVIDFGIAKAVDSGLAGGEALTEQAQSPGTPEYMSPEQAGSTGDIDTRSDVYSLGALLYELMVGAPPFRPVDLRGKTSDEIRRIVREVDPPLASARARALSPQAFAHLAELRSSKPEALKAMLVGELDWIAARALEKARSRRYSSADALQADLQCLLDGRVVAAVPPSTGYRLRKLVLRHRAAVLSSVAVAVTLLLGTIGTSIGWMRTVEARRATEEQRDISLATAEILIKDMLSGVDPSYEAGGSEVTVREMLDRAVTRLDSPEALGQVQSRSRMVVESAVRCAAARAYRALGLSDAALAQAEHAEALARSAPSPQPGLLSNALIELAEVRLHNFEPESALLATREATQLRLREQGARSLGYAEALSAQARAHSLAGEFETADELTQHSLKLYSELCGERSSPAAILLTELGRIRVKRGQAGDGILLLDRAAEVFRELFGAQHVFYVRNRISAGTAAMHNKDWSSAENYFRDANVQLARCYGDHHPELRHGRTQLAYVCIQQGTFAEAEALLSVNVQEARSVEGRQVLPYQNSLSLLANVHTRLGMHPQALQELEELEHNMRTAGNGGFGAWLVETTRAERVRTHVRVLQALLQSGGSVANDSSWAEQCLATMARLEQDLLGSFWALESDKAGTTRALFASESYRCKIARGLVELYALWAALQSVHSEGSHTGYAASELECWLHKLELLRERDQDPKLFTKQDP